MNCIAEPKPAMSHLTTKYRHAGADTLTDASKDQVSFLGCRCCTVMVTLQYTATHGQVHRSRRRHVHTQKRKHSHTVGKTNVL